MGRAALRVERLQLPIGLVGAAFVLAAAITGSRTLVAIGLALVLVSNLVQVYVLVKRRWP